AMDWSYQLLTAELQRFFARLSVFRGGCTLEAAEAVCGIMEAEEYGTRAHEVGGEVWGYGSEPARPDTHPPTPRPTRTRTLDSLAALRDASLILAEERLDGMRFRMLDTVCEYAREHLSEPERTRLRERHLQAYLALAEEAQPQLRAAEQGLWLDRLEVERDNVRAALEWAVESGSHWRALRMATAVATFWLVRGHPAEGRGWLERLLGSEEVGTRPGASDAGADAAELERRRAEAMVAAGDMARLQGDWRRARALYADALVLYTHLQDPLGAAYARFGTASILEDQG